MLIRKLSPHLHWHSCDLLMLQPVFSHFPVWQQSVSVEIRITGHFQMSPLSEPIFLADCSLIHAHHVIVHYQLLNFTIRSLVYMSRYDPDSTHVSRLYSGKHGKSCRYIILFTSFSVYQGQMLTMSHFPSNFVRLEQFSIHISVTIRIAMHCWFVNNQTCSSLSALWRSIRL